MSPSLPSHSCLPLHPIRIPLLSIHRFHIRSLDRGSDAGLIDLRTKGFKCVRMIIPGLNALNRQRDLKLANILIEMYSKAKIESLSIAPPVHRQSLFQRMSKDSGDGDDGDGNSADHVHSEELARALMKICFAWRWNRHVDQHGVDTIEMKSSSANRRSRRSTLAGRSNLAANIVEALLVHTDISDCSDAESGRSENHSVTSTSPQTSATSTSEPEAMTNAVGQVASRYISAFPTSSQSNHVLDGWNFFDPLSEHSRMGLLDPSSHFRVTGINYGYRLIPTYPSTLVVPKSINDKELENMTSFRSKGRIPCVVWSRRNVTDMDTTETTSATGGYRRVPNPEVVMLRSAQPMVGLGRVRNASDEAFLRAVAAVAPINRKIVIVDARPVANAVGQQAMGKGYELVENYTSHGLRVVSIHFCDIANIHVMRDADEALQKHVQHWMESKVLNATGLLNTVTEQAAVNTRGCCDINKHKIVTKDGAATIDTQLDSSTSSPSSSRPLDAVTCPHSCHCLCTSSHLMHHGMGDFIGSWMSGLIATGYFDHLGSILRGVNTIVHTITSGMSALVHCSDGWDRTSQLTSLSQLCLDPYYRTMYGFFTLIAKEWLSFGHKFNDRLGHGGIGGKENSPVFTQWLDCCYQIMSQFPHAFEFNEGLLLALRHSMHSAKYGSWFGDSERERKQPRNNLSRGNSNSKNSSNKADESNVFVAASSASTPATVWRLLDRTPSVFTHLWHHRHHFLNPSYEFRPRSASAIDFQDASSEYARNHPLTPDITKLRFWQDAYMPEIHDQDSQTHRLTHHPVPATPTRSCDSSASPSLSSSSSASLDQLQSLLGSIDMTTADTAALSHVLQSTLDRIRQEQNQHQAQQQLGATNGTVHTHIHTASSLSSSSSSSHHSFSSSLSTSASTSPPPSTTRHAICSSNTINANANAKALLQRESGNKKEGGDDDDDNPINDDMSASVTLSQGENADDTSVSSNGGWTRDLTAEGVESNPGPGASNGDKTMTSRTADQLSIATSAVASSSSISTLSCHAMPLPHEFNPYTVVEQSESR